MKKVFRNSSEVCHVFASQSQSEGRCSNVFFEDDKIYSYGDHFCMALILPGNRALISTRKYSVTTAKHLSEVRFALNHYERAYVPYPNLSLFGESRNGSNISYWIREFRTLYNDIGNTRKKTETRERAKLELKALVQNIENYLSWTDQKLKLPKGYEAQKQEFKEFLILFESAKNESTSEELSQKLAQQAAKEIKEKQAKQRKNLNSWLKGENIDTWHFNAIEKVYLRLSENEDGQIVETSKGANVSLRSAKILFELMLNGKDIKGFRLDDRYTVIGLNGVLSIGCHKIEREEINRFAKLMKWGQI